MFGYYQTGGASDELLEELYKLPDRTARARRIREKTGLKGKKVDEVLKEFTEYKKKRALREKEMAKKKYDWEESQKELKKLSVSRKLGFFDDSLHPEKVTKKDLESMKALPKTKPKRSIYRGVTISEVPALEGKKIAATTEDFPQLRGLGYGKKQCGGRRKSAGRKSAGRKSARRSAKKSPKRKSAGRKSAGRKSAGRKSARRSARRSPERVSLSQARKMLREYRRSFQKSARSTRRSTRRSAGKARRSVNKARRSAGKARRSARKSLRSARRSIRQARRSSARKAGRKAGRRSARRSVRRSARRSARR